MYQIEIEILHHGPVYGPPYTGPRKVAYCTGPVYGPPCSTLPPRAPVHTRYGGPCHIRAPVL